MADREKVINTLERCVNGCDDQCPYEYGGAVTLEYCRGDLMRDALDLLKERNWISVKDELPRTGRSVLVYVRRDDGVDTWYRTIAWMGEKNWDSCDPYFSAKDTITHWMPLPERPKGEDE